MSALYCINPNCPSPYPQPEQNKFCQRCGTALHLNQRYIALNQLGSGGFASIYTVWDERNRKEQVLKVLTITQKKAVQLFAQEAIVLRSLRHPGVPKVEAGSFFTTKTPKGELYCLVMERIKGKNLEELLEEDYPQGCPEILVYDWLWQVSAILDVLHQRQIIHRDIKPTNLMLRSGGASWWFRGGQVVLIDFGGAKQMNAEKPEASRSATRLFSSGYSPPEQIKGEGVQPNADIYALGRTMIHLLTGKFPPDIEDVNTGLLYWRQYAPVTPGLADLLDMMSHPEPQHRPQSARELQHYLSKLSYIRSHARTEAITQQLQHWGEQLQAGQRQFTEQLQKSLSLFWVFCQGVGRASLATLQATVFGGVGAILGAALGYVLLNETINETSLGVELTSRMNDGLNWLVEEFLDKPSNFIAVEPSLLLFAIAGIGTGLGLASAGSYEQKHHPIWVGIVGCLSYTLGGLLWQELASHNIDLRLFSMLGVIVFWLILGLGFASSVRLHLITSLCGTGLIFYSLLLWGDIPAYCVKDILTFDNLNLTLGFFAILAMSIGLSLGFSYYILRPITNWLGKLF